MSYPMYGGMSQGMLYPMGMASNPAEVSDKGKGKGREIDFDAAFAEFDQLLGPSSQETARIEELDDTTDLAEAMQRATLRDAGEQRQGRVGSEFES
jgi:peroxin-5